jgi:hypothetical protein
MAAIALGIVDAASSCLLGIEPKFGIRLAPLDVAGKQQPGQQCRERCGHKQIGTKLYDRTIVL